MAFSYRIITAKDRVIVVLEGTLDESARDPLFALKPLVMDSPCVTFDMGGVARINSFGLMHWVTFLRAMADGTFDFVACSSAFIEFVGMVPESARGGTIRSFYGTVHCSACDVETDALVQMPSSGRPAIPVCHECGMPGEPLGFLAECLDS